MTAKTLACCLRYAASGPYPSLPLHVGAIGVSNVAPGLDIKNLFRKAMRSNYEFSIRIRAARDVVVNFYRACCAKLPLLNPSVHSGLLPIYPANEVTCAETSRRLSSALLIS